MLPTFMSRSFLTRHENADVMTRRSTQLRWKRRIDRVVGFLLLLAFTPLMLLLAALVWRSVGSPILFRQKRPGFEGRSFELLKFRTMRDAVDRTGYAIPDSERLTPFGRFLRRTSLDELPELWNVLRGDMSLVGSRPLLMDYLERYTPEQARRHEMRPGITGWAQVNGRNALSWEEKFALDVWYVDNWSLWLDAKILLKTAWIVLKREGISGGGVETMTAFLPDANREPVCARVDGQEHEGS